MLTPRNATLHISGSNAGRDPDWSSHGPDAARTRRRRRFALTGLVAALAAGALALGVFTHVALLHAVWAMMRTALWLLPLLVALHLGQLFLAALGWRTLVGGAPPPSVFWRLRIAREGIDSLLPVAQVGGEIVGAQLLSRRGLSLSRAAASVIVDVSVELLTQLLFLFGGIVCLWMTGGPASAVWIKLLIATFATAMLCIAVQFLGGLRALEAVSRHIARRWPRIGSISLIGLQRAAHEIYADRRAMALGILLHIPAWVLGSMETWAVLNAMGVAATPAQAFVIEALGMAGRSAGFAIPAALGAQEGGFVLAAASVGIAAPAALALSLIKRLREVIGGMIGLMLWRLETSRKPAGARRLPVGTS